MLILSFSQAGDSSSSSFTVEESNIASDSNTAMMKTTSSMFEGSAFKDTAPGSAPDLAVVEVPQSTDEDIQAPEFDAEQVSSIDFTLTCTHIYK